jgi:hypothetical protein
MNPFDYVKQINGSKKDIMVDDVAEKAYNGFLVNRALSEFFDTSIAANEMNINHHIDNRLQFDFFINIIRKGKRFSKWAKADSIENIEVVKEYYGYSNEKARDALRLLTNDQIVELKKKVFKGGTTRTKGS